MSDPEEALATLIKWTGLPTPEREYVFHHARKWRFDFAWPRLRIAVEVEGGSWVAGRHNRGAAFEQDAIKYNEAALDGWTLLRVTPAMVDDGRAIAFIERALR